MDKDFTQKQLEKVENRKIEGQKKAMNVECELKKISKYLDDFFGPVDPEVIAELENTNNKEGQR